MSSHGAMKKISGKAVKMSVLVRRGAGNVHQKTASAECGAVCARPPKAVRVPCREAGCGAEGRQGRAAAGSYEGRLAVECRAQVAGAVAVGAQAKRRRIHTRERRGSG